jgi:hypothetical protein
MEKWNVADFVSLQCEEKTNARAVRFVGAARSYAPPMLIYKTARICEHLKRGAPPGFYFCIQPRQRLRQKRKEF